jgi:2',3'-cyclic-nucleotide 2'-phosphodiesterase (5'-nucleotidase family)
VAKKYTIFFIIFLLCFVQCAKRTILKSTPNLISIIYINNWQYNQASKIAALIKNEQKSNPLLVIINNNIFSELPFTELNKGYGEIELLNNCPIDAVLLNPEFLRWGIQHTKELIRKSNFSYLAANIKDKTTGQLLGQEYLFKTVGKAQIAITGISFDSSDCYFQDRNLEFRNPDFSIMKLLPLIKEHSDFQFILTRTQDSLDLPVNLIFGAPIKNQVPLVPINQPGIYKIEFTIDNMKNITELKRTTISLDTISPDIVAESIISQYQTNTNALLRTELTINNNQNISEKAIKIMLTETKTLSFLSDLPLINEGFTTKDISITDLFNRLNQKNTLPILLIKGKELSKFTTLLSPPIKKISNDKEYPILTTIDFLNKHPEVKYESIEFSTHTVWEILSNNLK